MVKRLCYYTLFLCAFCGCIDSNYDLSDIDTNVRIKVNDLIVPINLNPVEMKTIIDFDEDNPDSKIKVVDNQYAVVIDGTFESKSIVVDAVNLSPRSITSSSSTLISYVPQGVKSLAVSIPETANSSFAYSYSGVSDAIVAMESLGVEWSISVTISLDKLRKRVKSFALTDLVIAMPKGLTGTPDIGVYDPENGNITIAKTTVTGNSLTVTMTISAINIDKAGVIFTPTDHYINFSGDLGLKSGNIDITTVDNYSSTATLDLEVSPSMSFLKIKKLTGTINYNISGLTIPTVSLDDLPSVLTQSNTDIRLANPQIILAINNPLSQYGVTGNATLAITPIRNGMGGKQYKPDGDGTINIGTNSASGTYNLILSPSLPAKIYGGYSSINYARFSSLANLLSGEGMPTSLKIELNDAKIANARVSDLQLGSYGPISGKYTFYSPLEFDKESTIYYSHDDTGLSEEFQNITIETLKISATVSSNLPMNLRFDVIPLDRDGNPLNAYIQGAEIAPGATNEQLDVTLIGTIKGIYGLRYTARAAPDNSSRALAPNQKITLSDIKATITGYYDKEL